MSIYTKTGDKGSTALVGGSRVAKTDIQVETYGTVDELNTQISLAQKAITDKERRDELDEIQQQLFYLGAELATPTGQSLPANQSRITDADISALERIIDKIMATMAPVHSFVLPGRCESASRLHVARAVARRAERRVIALSASVSLRSELIRYLNRLSDCLYALARAEDQQAQINTVISEVVSRYQAALTNSDAAKTPQPATQHKTCPLPDCTHKALALMKAAIFAARDIGIPMVFALVDKHGNTILSYRMPGALLVSSELAVKKAYSAVALKMPTHELHEAVQPGQDLFQLEASGAGKLVSFGGGYPLYHKDNLIGGIGISGGTVAQDMHVAQAVLRAATKALASGDEDESE